MLYTLPELNGKLSPSIVNAPLRRTVLVLVFALLYGGMISPQGFDFGAQIDNNTLLEWRPDAALVQRSSLSAWSRAGIGDSLTLNLQASFTYTIPIPIMLDVDHIGLQGSFPELFGPTSLFRIEAGRFQHSDFAGAVFVHRVDGVRAELHLPRVSVLSLVGYTGLLLKPTSGIVLSRNDLVDRHTEEVVLAPPRLVESVELSFRELFARQTLTAGVFLQQDLRGEDATVQEGETVWSDDTGGPVHSAYFGLGLSGPLTPFLSYRAFAHVQTGSMLGYLSDYSYQRVAVAAFHGAADITLHLERLLSSQIRAALRYASGDAAYESFVDGSTTEKTSMWAPVSGGSPRTLIFTPQPGNTATLRIEHTARPFAALPGPSLRRLQTVGSATTFFRSTIGPISVVGLNPDSAARYLGTELSLAVRYRPFSDLGVLTAFALFLPHADPESGSLLPSVWTTATGLQLRLVISL